MEEKIDMNGTQIDLVHTLTLGLHLITKRRLGLCMSNSIHHSSLVDMRIVYDMLMIPVISYYQ